MCMLFGVSSERRFISNEYLRKFYQNSDKHPHGWGLACGGKYGFNIEKESVNASKSSYLNERLKSTVDNEIVMAHIRYATIGNVEHDNCHPFFGYDSSGRQWVLIHNGTIFEYLPLSIYSKLQTGDTDSERILMHFIEEIDKQQTEQKLKFDERFKLLDRIIYSMAKGNKLNLIFSDGKYLYVHTNCKDTLYSKSTEQGVIFSTVPLDNEKWEPVKMCTLLAYRSGKLVNKGVTHSGVFTESPENMRLLYQIFSGL